MKEQSHELSNKKPSCQLKITKLVAFLHNDKVDTSQLERIIQTSGPCARWRRHYMY